MKKNAARWISLLLILCLSLSAVLTGCGGDNNASNDGSDSSGTGESTRDTLNYGLNQEPAKLDPQSDSLLVTMLACRQVYDTLLVKDDTTGEIKANLATDWEWVDELTLHMTLRDDVYFHNGDKMTAEDVIFTLRRCATGTPATIFSCFDTEASSAIDDTHIEIKMKEPYGAALSMLCNTKSSIVSKSYFESVDETTFGREPVGTGAFSFVDWVSGDHITLTRNDQYWGQKPAYTTLTLRVLTDATARAIELETGGVDIIDTMNVSDIKRFDESEDINVYTIAGSKVHYLVCNETDPILGNEKVRLAFAHAIEMANVCEAGFGDSADVARSSMATTIWGYKDVGLYTYDVELAKQLLAEAGYPDGFTCSIVVPNMSSNVKMAETIQAYLREIGVTLEIESYDAATWMSMCRDGSAAMSIQNLTVDSFDPDHNYMNLKAGSSVATVRSTDATLNALLDEGKSEMDDARRMEIYGEVQDYIFEHAILLPIDEPVINYGTQPYVKGFVANALVQPDLKLVYFE